MTTTWYAAPTSRRRMPFWAKAVLTVVAVCCLGAVLFVLAVVVSFSGGLDDALDFRHPKETDKRVVQARDASVARLPGLLAEITGSGTVTLSGDSCSVGQHNFKIDDDYDLDCVAAVATVLPASPSGTDGVTAPAGWHEVPLHAGAGQRLWRTGSGTGELELSVTVERADELYAYDLLGQAGDHATTHQVVQELRSSYPGTPLLVVRVSERYFSE